MCGVIFNITDKPWLLCVWHPKSPISSSLWSSLVCLSNLNLWKIWTCRRSRKNDFFWCCTFVIRIHLPFPGPCWSLHQQVPMPLGLSCHLWMPVHFLSVLSVNSFISMDHSSLLFVLLYTCLWHLSFKSYFLLLYFPLVSSSFRHFTLSFTFGK